jgi:hypothetical protein
VCVCVCVRVCVCVSVLTVVACARGPQQLHSVSPEAPPPHGHASTTAPLTHVCDGQRLHVGGGVREQEHGQRARQLAHRERRARQVALNLGPAGTAEQ